MEEKTGDVMGNTHRKSVRLNREGKKSARWVQVQVRKTTRRQKKEDSSCKLMVKLTAVEQQNQSEKTERGEKGGRKREREICTLGGGSQEKHLSTARILWLQTHK